jgi:hypothetical protein
VCWRWGHEKERTDRLFTLWTVAMWKRKDKNPCVGHQNVMNFRATGY